MKSSTLLAALTATACGGNAAAPPASTPAATAPKASASASVNPVAPSAATKPTEAASPFQVLGELGGDLQLFGAGERGFLLSQAGVELQLVGDEVVQDPLLKRGIPTQYGMISVEAIAGRWPDALWLSTTEPSGRSGFSTLWSWDGKSWQRGERTTEGHFIVGMNPWLGGRMLALDQAGMMFDASFRVLSGDKKVALPKFAKAPSNGDFSYCMTQIKVDAWSTLPAGDVIALGERCDPSIESPQLAVARWAPGNPQAIVDIMPDTDEPAGTSVGWSGGALAAISPTDIFVAAAKWKSVSQAPAQDSDYFAHFDGKSWLSLPTPIPDGIDNLWVESDGVVFAENRKRELWARSVQGAWARVTWPARVAKQDKPELMSFWPRAPGDVWALVQATTDGYPHTYLLHTRPAKNPMPTPEAVAHKEQQYALPGPPVEWCSTPFVLLYTLGRKSPANYDYPATRDALKGHGEFAELEFVEFERDGRKFFGARVPDFKVGKKLAQLVKDKVTGSTPQLVCHDPTDTRKLDIDLKTGQLRH
jgi:hypothetical protein